MAPVAVYVVNSNGQNNNPLTTPSFTPAQNERIVISVTTADSTAPVSGVSGSANSLTYASRYANTTSGYGAVYLWTTVVTPSSPVAMTITATPSGSTSYRQMVVSRWTDVTIASSPVVGSARNTSASASLTTTASNSTVVWTLADWNGINPGTPTYRSGAAALGAPYYFNNGSGTAFTGYSGYQVAGSAGAQTFGISSPSGMKAHLAGIELLSAPTAAAALSGSGALSAGPVIPNVVNAVLQGAGKLTAGATHTRFLATALQGSGDLDTSPLGDRAAAVSLAGASTLTVGATPARVAAVLLAGESALSASATVSTLTSPALTAENLVGYFALRDLGLATGDTTYAAAADTLKTALLRDHWNQATRRFSRAMGDDTGSLQANVLGGLFLLAIGDRARARDVVRHLRHYRVKNAEIDAFHIDGPSSLIGYKPYGEGYLDTPGLPARFPLRALSVALDGEILPETDPFYLALNANLQPDPPVVPPDGPKVIDQAGSWAATLFKHRYGEPVGDDVRSLQRWRFNHDDSSYLYGSQWLNYSTDSAPGDSVALRARPYLGSAAWAYLLTTGAQDLLALDPVALPQVTSLTLTSRYDRPTRKMVLRASWTRDGAPCAAYEAALELTTNSGTTWSAAVPRSRDSIERARSGSGYILEWKLSVPSNSATRYRARVRLRNARFGTWVTSSQVAPPTI